MTARNEWERCQHGMRAVVCDWCADLEELARVRNERDEADTALAACRSEATAQIRSLTERVTALRAALAPFVAEYAAWDGDDKGGYWALIEIAGDHYTAAQAALKERP
jgi:hypothetical protein